MAKKSFSDFCFKSFKNYLRTDSEPTATFFTNEVICNFFFKEALGFEDDALRFLEDIKTGA